MPSRPRKYTDEEIKTMEHMRYQLRMSLLSISLVYGTTKRDIERQLKNFGPVQEGKPIKAPNVKVNWDFSGENL